MTTTSARLVAPPRRGSFHRVGPSAVSAWAHALRATSRPHAVRPTVRRRGLLRDVVGAEVLAVSAMLAMLVLTALV